MRAIDADKIPYTMLYKEDWLKGSGCEAQGAWKKDIDAMPTIEPERKTGRWINYDSDTERYDDIKCSNCGKTFTVDSDRYCDIGFIVSDLHYCPNCGAKMEVEHETD